jgi:ubiquitin-like protein Pup
MSEQVKTKPARPAKEEQQATTGTTTLAKKGDELKESIDKLLDEIDDLLEENAEEFVAGYVQRGGE